MDLWIEAPAVWDNDQRPDEQRMPSRGRSDRGTGAGRSAEGNDKKAGDVGRRFIFILSQFAGVHRSFRNTDWFSLRTPYSQ
jgi:hypothetical protein